ncbi:hypothetical protein F4780DRAFT_708746 [Xylariomycetidae sp. FL0641]|nr:hypothetical protein F4780DRAFT_708746 [Xylariomycetidae sp. FL0641]
MRATRKGNGKIAITHPHAPNPSLHSPLGGPGQTACVCPSWMGKYVRRRPAIEEEGEEGEEGARNASKLAVRARSRPRPESIVVEHHHHHHRHDPSNPPPAFPSAMGPFVREESMHTYIYLSHPNSMKDRDLAQPKRSIADLHKAPKVSTYIGNVPWYTFIHALDMPTDGWIDRWGRRAGGRSSLKSLHFPCLALLPCLYFITQGIQSHPTCLPAG